MARLIQAVLEHVKGGKSFSEALKQFPRVFSPLYVNLVKAGEVGGMLDQTLDRLARFMEQEEDFRSRLLAALAYPLLIVAVGLLTVIFLMVFVIPRLSAMFVDSGQGLPWIARMLTAISHMIASPAGGILFVVTGGSLWAMLYRKPEEAKVLINRALFKLPLCGTVLQKGILARFTRTLAMLLTGGVPVIQALEVVSAVLDHPEFSRQVQQVAREVEQGENLSTCLKRAGMFPPFVCQKIAIGEESNTMEKALEIISVSYERETDRAMKLATSMLEPLMILGVGSVIGVIVIGMLLPIFQISTFVK
jgi:type II secretory pathway component PulF